MTDTKTLFKCPTCKKELSEEEYNKAVGIIKELRSIGLKKYHEGIIVGTKRQEEQVNRLTKQNVKLQETIKHLKDGTSPQTVGFGDEITITNNLQQQFPNDDIQHHGKRGDIFHIVYNENISQGKIVYECKHKPFLNQADIVQTYNAKLRRKADYGILVTTGKSKRKQFEGFSYDKEYEIFIIEPNGLIGFVSFIRNILIVLYRSQLPIEQRNSANKQLLEYITQGEGFTSIKTIVQQSVQSYANLLKEIKETYSWWELRRDTIEITAINGLTLQNNINLILSGNNYKPLEYKRQKQLAIPKILLPSNSLESQNSNSPEFNIKNLLNPIEDGQKEVANE